MPSIELPFETELKIDGMILNAPFAGKYQIDARTGDIDAIGVQTWDGRRFVDMIKWLPDGQIYDLLHLILTDEYSDQIDEALEEWRIAGSATRADDMRDLALA
jgi:hypothetical protein